MPTRWCIDDNMSIQEKNKEINRMYQIMSNNKVPMYKLSHKCNIPNKSNVNQESDMDYITWNLSKRENTSNPKYIIENYSCKSISNKKKKMDSCNVQ